ncbi:hypothetical protein RF11_03301 [Thelohanellus kitauei]|uniref:Uncharacterized protein n=1 Tax=Thelohanellus kitauei TaxID=669202 RepID=A0A0C2MWA8_THEKT|nr:hypothetical protein RF11_03301 [Thelohanellus kitauei]
MNNSCGIVRNPSSINEQTAQEELRMEQIDVQFDSVLRDKFGSIDKNINDLCLFYKNIIDVQNNLFWQAVVSVKNLNKSKYLSKLTDMHLNSALKVSTAQTLTSDFDGFVSAKRCQIPGTTNYLIT